MNNITYALKVANEYYTKEGYEHALRVAAYVIQNPMIPEEKMDTCTALAIMHDLLEDTEYDDKYDLDDEFRQCLDLLTKEKDEDYETYLSEIRNCSDKHPEAYWVKMADMKDHLSQKETLTDKLKEKYLNALPALL